MTRHWRYVNQKDMIVAPLTRILIIKFHSGIGGTPITKKAAMNEIIMYASSPKISLWTIKILLYLLFNTISQLFPIGQIGFSEAIRVRIR